MFVVQFLLWHFYNVWKYDELLLVGNKIQTNAQLVSNEGTLN